MNYKKVLKFRIRNYFNLKNQIIYFLLFDKIFMIEHQVFLLPIYITCLKLCKVINEFIENSSNNFLQKGTNYS